ncbi:MAG: type II toxin-antitoxin system VapC family toxin [Chloroflexi bacterium]|nr:type II toxin-antitoxin system VapC family toxin [Chloroflexota bacterium]
MSVNAVFDSDVLIDYLSGLEAARETPEIYERWFISIVSFIEVLTGADTPEEESTARDVLNGFEIVPISLEIAERAIALRRSHRRLKTPDAIVWATAQQAQNCVLVTRNTKDFPADGPGIRVPYRL